MLNFRKKIYLIHGWEGTGFGGWFDWLKKELKDKVTIIAFDMPNTDEPVIEEWVGFLQQNVKDLDEQTFFVGHSLGVQTILRFLEKLKKGKKVGGCCFVAGFFDLNLKKEKERDKEIIMPWINTAIDFEKVKTHCNDFVAIFSDNDPDVQISNAKIFEDKLGARIIILKNKGHFTFDEVVEIPEVLEFLSSKMKLNLR